MQTFGYLYIISMTNATIAALPCFHCFHFDNTSPLETISGETSEPSKDGTFLCGQCRWRLLTPLRFTENVELFQVVVWPVVSQRKKPWKKVDVWRWQEIFNLSVRRFFFSTRTRWPTNDSLSKCAFALPQGGQALWFVISTNRTL